VALCLVYVFEMYLLVKITAYTVTCHLHLCALSPPCHSSSNPADYWRRFINRTGICPRRRSRPPYRNKLDTHVPLHRILCWSSHNRTATTAYLWSLNPYSEDGDYFPSPKNTFLEWTWHSCAMKCQSHLSGCRLSPFHEKPTSSISAEASTQKGCRYDYKHPWTSYHML
jgi:hypothetical protein